MLQCKRRFPPFDGGWTSATPPGCASTLEAFLFFDKYFYISSLSDKMRHHSSIIMYTKNRTLYLRTLVLTRLEERMMEHKQETINEILELLKTADKRQLEIALAFIRSLTRK